MSNIQGYRIVLYCVCPVLFGLRRAEKSGIYTKPERKDYYSKNLSILNRSSYCDSTLFWDAKIIKIQEIVTLFNYKSPNFKDCSEVISADPPIQF